MRSIKITRTRVTKRALADAAAVLRDGGVVVFPTETAYGLAAVPADRAAQRKIFNIKGRPEHKTLPFVADSLATVRKHFVLAGAAARLAARHWPGPLTLVLKPRGAAARRVYGADAAIRVPALAWARAIARAAGGIATSTSANLSGQPTLYGAAAAKKTLGGNARSGAARPDLLLDAGTLPKRAPSTIVRVDAKGAVIVLRQGSITP